MPEITEPSVEWAGNSSHFCKKFGGDRRIIAMLKSIAVTHRTHGV